ncbi:MAG: DMT family transporter [Flavobacteriales bacterium]|nr:DMT family transporter [Flavobacteriales bacterium]
MIEATKNKSSAVLIALCGALLFSSKAVLIKFAYQYDVDKLSLLVLRMGFALPFYLFFAFKSNANPKATPIKKKDWILLVYLGIIGYYFASFLDLWGLEFISAGMERLILFIYPTITTILIAITFKRKISRNTWIAILLTYVGISIAFWEKISLNDNTDFWFGALLIFGSALTFSFYLVGSEKLIPKFGSKKFTSYCMIVSCIGVLVHFGIQNSIDITSFRWEVYSTALAIAFFSTVLPSFMMSMAIKQIGASTTAIISSVGPIWVLVLAYFVLGEEFYLLQISGTAIVILGILLISKEKG